MSKTVFLVKIYLQCIFIKCFFPSLPLFLLEAFSTGTENLNPVFSTKYLMTGNTKGCSISYFSIGKLYMPLFLINYSEVTDLRFKHSSRIVLLQRFGDGFLYVFWTFILCHISNICLWSLSINLCLLSISLSTLYLLK